MTSLGSWRLALDFRFELDSDLDLRIASSRDLAQLPEVSANVSFASATDRVPPRRRLVGYWFRRHRRARKSDREPNSILKSRTNHNLQLELERIKAAPESACPSVCDY